MTQPHNFATASESHARRRVSIYFQILFSVCLILTAGTQLGVQANSQAGVQEKAQPLGSRKPAPKKKYRLRISKGDMTGISLKANDAKMSEIAAELSKKLDTRVILGPRMAKLALTVEFYDLLLEPGLRLMAPRVYIDYEVRADAQPKIVGIFLQTEEDPVPASNAIVQGGAEAFLIEGSTEDTGEAAENTTDDDPLHVELDGNLLTVKSKKQPLAAVLLTIAEVLGVPAEIRYEGKEIVDTSLKDIPFEDAIARLSPNVRVYFRADLTRSQRIPLRLALVPPPAPKVPDSEVSQSSNLP
jgi:hypothetical protein